MQDTGYHSPGDGLLELRAVKRTSRDISLPPDAVFSIISNIERTLRLNPHWTIKNFQPSKSTGVETGTSVSFDLEDYGSGKSFSVQATCEQIKKPQEMRIAYSGWNKILTVFFIGQIDNGSRLTVEETYTEDEPDENFEWHNTQLTYWVRSISAYLHLCGRTGFRDRANRFFMDWLWIPATPSGRRISIILLKISIVELVIIIAIIVMWSIFSGK